MGPVIVAKKDSCPLMVDLETVKLSAAGDPEDAQFNTTSEGAGVVAVRPVGTAGGGDPKYDTSTEFGPVVRSPFASTA